jgi:hypothetical protein
MATARYRRKLRTLNQPMASNTNFNTSCSQPYVITMSEKTAWPAERTGASAEAIMSHYDMGNDFFRLILDPR